MASNSFCPIRRANTSDFPASVSRNHFPSDFTIGIGNSQSSLPDTKQRRRIILLFNPHMLSGARGKVLEIVGILHLVARRQFLPCRAEETMHLLMVLGLDGGQQRIDNVPSLSNTGWPARRLPGYCARRLRRRGGLRWPLLCARATRQPAAELRRKADS